MLRRSDFWLWLCVVGFAFPAHAKWSLSLGYQNPPGSQIGFNLAHQWPEWMAEAGIGLATLRKEDPDTGNRSNVLSFGADIGAKYFFKPGTVRPFVEGGFSTTAGFNAPNQSGGFNGLFAGLGCTVEAKDAYAYLGLVLGQGTFFSAGLGFFL